MEMFVKETNSKKFKFLEGFLKCKREGASKDYIIVNDWNV